MADNAALEDLRVLWKALMSTEPDIAEFTSENNEELAICKIAVSQTEDAKWLGESQTKFLQRKVYLDILNWFFVNDDTETNLPFCGLVSGTTGSGKSCIFNTALIIMSKIKVEGQTPNVLYSSQDVDGNINIMLRSDGEVEFWDRKLKPHYHLLDGVDLSVIQSTCGTLVVTSTELPTYNKLLAVYKMRRRGGIFYMPMFTADEMSCVLDCAGIKMTKASQNLRMAIFGGHFTNFIGTDDTYSKNTISVVTTVMDLHFTSAVVQSVSNLEWQQIKNNLSLLLQRAMRMKEGITGSLFQHQSYCSDCVETTWATPFMRDLAIEVVSAQEKTLTEYFQDFAGMSAYGAIFEGIGHKKLLLNNSDTTSPAFYAQSLTKVDDKVAIPRDMHVQLIKTIADVAKLEDNVYGLPCITNYPFADSVIQPNIIINFATADKKHSSSDAAKYLGQFKEVMRDAENIKVIFVIQPKSVADYQGVKELAEMNVSQYIMLLMPVTNEDILMTDHVKAKKMQQHNIEQRQAQLAPQELTEDLQQLSVFLLSPNFNTTTLLDPNMSLRKRAHDLFLQLSDAKIRTNMKDCRELVYRISNSDAYGGVGLFSFGSSSSVKNAFSNLDQDNCNKKDTTWGRIEAFVEFCANIIRNA